MCPRRHPRALEVPHDRTSQKWAAGSACVVCRDRNRGLRRHHHSELVRRAATNAAAPADAASSGNHRDSWSGPNASGRHGETSRSTSIQSPRARAGLLRSRFLAVDSATVGDRRAPAGPARLDCPVWRRFSVPRSHERETAGHASCSSQAVRKARAAVTGCASQSR